MHEENNGRGRERDICMQEINLSADSISSGLLIGEYLDFADTVA